MGRSCIQYRHQYRPLGIIRRYCCRVPLFVAVGTALTSHITKFRHIVYDSSGNSIPTSTTWAFAFDTHHRFYGSDVKGRREISSLFWTSSNSNYNSACFPIPLIQLSTEGRHQLHIPGFRLFSNINEHNGEESWESDSDEDSDDVDETSISILESNNSDDYDVVDDDDDDDDEYIDPLGQDVSVDQSNEIINTTIEDPTDILIVEYERWSIAVDKAISALEKKKFSLEKEFSKAEQLES